MPAFKVYVSGIRKGTNVEEIVAEPTVFALSANAAILIASKLVNADIEIKQVSPIQVPGIV